MSDIMKDRFYISIPSKRSKDFEQIWLDYSGIIISRYMKDPWALKTWKDPLKRRDYIEKYIITEFYDNCILKGSGSFAIIKMKDTKYSVIGGVCLEVATNIKRIHQPQNHIESRLNHANEKIHIPLKSIADKYNTEVWYFTKQVTDLSIHGLRIGAKLTIEASKALLHQKLLEYQQSGKVLPHPPLAYGVMFHEALNNHVLKQERDLIFLGSVTYHDEAFGQATDFVCAYELPGTKAILQEAKLAMSSQSNYISKL